MCNRSLRSGLQGAHLSHNLEVGFEFSSSPEVLRARDAGEADLAAKVSAWW